MYCHSMCSYSEKLCFIFIIIINTFHSGICFFLWGGGGAFHCLEFQVFSSASLINRCFVVAGKDTVDIIGHLYTPPPIPGFSKYRVLLFGRSRQIQNLHVFVTKLISLFLHLTKLKVNFNVSWIVNNGPKYVHDEGAVIAIS